MSSPTVGSLLITAGLALAAIGVLVSLGGFAWFGRLPGDIRIERESMRIYVPFASMIVISLGFSLVLYIVRRFF